MALSQVTILKLASESRNVGVTGNFFQLGPPKGVVKTLKTGFSLSLFFTYLYKRKISSTFPCLFAQITVLKDISFNVSINSVWCINFSTNVWCILVLIVTNRIIMLCV